MPLPAAPTDAFTFLAALNGDLYDPDANPFGMDDGGHIPNWPPAMNDTAEVGNYLAALGTYLQQLADQVAADAASAAAGSGAEVTVEQIRAGAAAQYLSIRRVYAAAAPVALVDAATIAVDLDTGINFAVTLGGNRTLGNPTNADVGKSGFVIVSQDATGGRTLAKGSNWKVAGGDIILDQAAGARNVISYFVESENSVLATVSEFFA